MATFPVGSKEIPTLLGVVARLGSFCWGTETESWRAVWPGVEAVVDGREIDPWWGGMGLAFLDPLYEGLGLLPCDPIPANPSREAGRSNSWLGPI